MPKDDLRSQGPIQPAFYPIDPQGLSPAGLALIQANSGLISRFVEHQRDQVRLGNLDQQRQTLKLVDLDVEYYNSNGQERIRLSPRPPGRVEQLEEVTLQPVYDNPYRSEPPTEDYPQLCMLVLYQYKGLCCYAAIPMGSLVPVLIGQPPNFVVVHTHGDLTASYQQPVAVGQYNFGGFNFIVTDVDLSGNMLPKSTLCTTLLFDAISLGQQTVPIVNSPTGVGGQPDPLAMLQLFTPSAAVVYQNGKLSITAMNQNAQYNAQAVDNAGNLYYGFTCDLGGPSADGVAIVAMSTYQSTLDQTGIVAPMLATTIQNTTYVPFYDLAYTNIMMYTYMNTYDAPTSLETFDLFPDPVTGQMLTYSVTFATRSSLTRNTETGELTVVSIVTPSAGDTAETQNLNPITEILGTSYYGVSTYGQPMSFPNINQAHDNVPYYEWVQSDLAYEYNIPSPDSQVSYSNNLYRMVYDLTGAISCMPDRVEATATATQLVTTASTQLFPGWGGDLVDGITGETDPTTYFDGDDALIIHSGGHAQQLVAHLANAEPSIGVTLIFPPTGGLPSYANALSFAESAKANMFVPVPGLNGGPGPVNTYTNSETTTQATSSHDVDTIDQYSGRHYALLVYDAPVNSDVTGGNYPAGASYKAQYTGFTYNSTITFSGHTVSGNVAALPGEDGSFNEVQQSIGQVVFFPFPPGTTQLAYAAFLQGSSTTAEACTISTPYKDFKFGSYAGNELVGWMHVSDPNFTLQGFTIGKVPYIYLNNMDVTQALATTLGCNPTDIAACYFDIELDTIKALASVR